MYPNRAGVTPFQVRLCLGQVKRRVFLLGFAGTLIVGTSTLLRDVQLPRRVTISKETTGLIFQKLDYPNLWQLIANSYLPLLLFIFCQIGDTSTPIQ